MSWPKKHKFSAQRTSVDGYSFPSKLEAAVYGILKLRVSAGEISELKCQKTFLITKANISWKVDFHFYVNDLDCWFAAEAKGIETADYRIKLKLWRHYGHCPLEIWKGVYQKPFLKETIIPK